MSADVLYVAQGLGATVRGVAVLRALGRGTLFTAHGHVAEREGVPWTRCLRGSADCYVWDRPGPPWRPGLQVVVGEGEGFDLCLDWPIVPRRVDELDPARAEAWWGEPLAMHVGAGTVRIVQPGGGPRILRLGRPGPGEAGRFLFGPEAFYWPAMELMTRADEVIGGGQSLAEWGAVRGELPDDGAARAAETIRRLLG